MGLWCLHQPPPPPLRCEGTGGIQLQLDDNREAECNLYKEGVEGGCIPPGQAVEFSTDSHPERMELAFLAHALNRITYLDLR